MAALRCVHRMLSYAFGFRDAADAMDIEGSTTEDDRTVLGEAEELKVYV